MRYSLWTGARTRAHVSVCADLCRPVGQWAGTGCTDGQASMNQVQSMCRATAVIAHDGNERNYLLFKLAYKFASEGLRCTIITKAIPHSGFERIINERRFLQPHVLEMIQFRHFSSATALIDWCHGFQTGQTMPHAILLNGFEDFCDPSDFLAYYLCACLVDSAGYFGKSLLDRQMIDNFHLILSFNTSTYDNRPAFFDMFGKILNAEEVVKEFLLTLH